MQLTENIAADSDDSSRVERMATWLSLACAVHCMAVPLLTVAAPFVSLGSMVSPVSETALVASVVIFSLLSSVLGYRRHRDLRAPLFVAAALVVYGLGHLSEGAPYGVTLSVVGSLLLSAALFFSTRRAHVHGQACAH